MLRGDARGELPFPQVSGLVERQPRPDQVTGVIAQDALRQARQQTPELLPRPPVPAEQGLHPVRALMTCGNGQLPAVRPRIPRQRPDVVQRHRDGAPLPHHPAQQARNQRVRSLPHPAATTFADILWMETKTADLADARRIAEAIQTLVGGPRSDAALLASSGGTAATQAMGKGSTQHQHLVQTEVPRLMTLIHLFLVDRYKIWASTTSRAPRPGKEPKTRHHLIKVPADADQEHLGVVGGAGRCPYPARRCSPSRQRRPDHGGAGPHQRTRPALN